LVIGGTRGTGKAIVSRLLRDGVAVRALARNAAAARAVLSSSIEIVEGDVTKVETLHAALIGAAHVIFTAGVTKRPASERSIIAVEYHGVTNTLAVAKATGFAGRFLYMTAIGIRRHSIESIGLNLIKGNTLKWRRRAEEEIRRSGVNYTIVRCATLTNDDGSRAVELSQRERRMSLFRRIGRKAAASVFMEALLRSAAQRTTFEASWSSRGESEPWDTLFSRLQPDSVLTSGP
jgi:Predicted nucleoside-diphosphate-sugar epimerases